MKTRFRKKHEALLHHFERFLDPFAYPGYVPTQEDRINFLTYQGKGRAPLSDEEFERIEPLLHAQEGKEIQIKGLVEEMASFYSMGWGWYVPMMDEISREFQTRHEHGDRIFIKAMIQITREIQKVGFINFLVRYTGLTNEQKAFYIDRHIKTINEYFEAKT
jgi:hypothetical protein